MSKIKSKILILCVDRDNDIGAKAGITTPIVGREKNLKAASKLALTDPEESDANAMFGAIRIFDTLSFESESDEYEVVTIAGSERGGIRADRQLRDQLLRVLEQVPSDNVIVVTDGFNDERVIPIIQSRVSIMSVERVVIKHSGAIEESWALLYRYLRKVVEDPYYARWVLGTPGIILITLAILWFLSSYFYIPIGLVAVFFLGLSLMIKGFGLDKLIIGWIPSPPNLIRIFTSVASLIIVALGIYQTYLSLVRDLGDPQGWLLILPIFIGKAIQHSVDLILIASFISILGLFVYFYFLRDPKIWWTVVGFVASLWMREVAIKTSDILQYSLPVPIPISLIQNLIFVVCLGIITTVIMIFMTIILGKRFESYFNRREV